MSEKTTEKRTARSSEHTAYDDGLSPRQHVAVVALLASPTVKAAAEAAKVSRCCLQLWLRQPAFRKAVAQARHLAVRQASAYLQGLAAEAAKTLALVLKEKNASAASRVSAARVVLEIAYQPLEADEIAERLERLESLQKGDG